jgi:Raf kinase inhibitor-like YbhB/YbcL family protein
MRKAPGLAAALPPAMTRMKRVLGMAVMAASALAPAASAQTPAQIVVESPTMTTGQMMPRDYSPDGRNVSPPLTWRNLPTGTRQIAVICQDHGAGNPPPWVHWIIYNIPATARGLPEGIPFDPSDPMPAGLEGATQGNNNWGLAMYRGPAPPAGTVHDYDFTVFALDAELNLPPRLTRAQLLEAIEGHVIGQGNMVPNYTRQPEAGGGLE